MDETTMNQKCPKPATSVHLFYKLPTFKVSDIEEIKFHNKLNVTNSSNKTYFSAIQFWPRGYCGIQQRTSSDDKIAIFSLWNEEDNAVKLVECGNRVTVQPFGGEGTGLKCTRPLEWCIGDNVGFTITVNRECNEEYRVKCEIEFRDSTIFMCTFQRKSAPPSLSFVSFVEDYDRSAGACGLMYPRSCTFEDTHCIINGTRHELKQATFSKVKNGHDAHGNDRCTGGVNGSGYFFLHTGNTDPMDDLCCQGTVCTRPSGQE